MIIIGDIHGKISEYQKIIEKHSSSLQLGDFGFKSQYEWYINNIDMNRHKIIMGNHDDTNYLKYTNGNFSYDVSNEIFSIRGAMSIDKSKRISGIDWFENEELNYLESMEVMDEYEKIKPKIVVSHDCPAFVAEEFFGFPQNDINYKSKTRTFLNVLYDIHKPELWIFGHNHKHIDSIINGTRFICLAELETFVL